MRYEHTLGVSYTCQALAMRYGYDLDKAELAGLLHDCAKRYDGETLLSKCLARNLQVTPSEERDPSLLHAKLGAYMAREKYGVEDPEILQAIECHTTGRCGMTLLDKILYAADYIEPRRYKAGNLPEMQKLAFLDLDEACLAIMESTLTYLRSREFSIDTATVLACEDMKRAVEEKRKHIKIQDIKNQMESKEETAFETVKRAGENRRRGIVREKRRRYKNYRH